MASDRIIILAIGGTFDKVYHDALSHYQIGSPQSERILQQAGVGFEYRIKALVGKDSLDMDDDDRMKIRESVEASDGKRFVITHGTDTMAETAQALGVLKEKTVVLTGSMSPARFRDTDADFNLGFAICAVQLLPPGVHVAMNGKIFDPWMVSKNRAAGRFEERDRDRSE